MASNEVLNIANPIAFGGEDSDFFPERQAAIMAVAEDCGRLALSGGEDGD